MSFRGKSDSPTPIYKNCSENFSGVSYQMRLEQDRLGSFLRQPSCSEVLFRSMGFRWNTTEARWSYQLRMNIWKKKNVHMSPSSWEHSSKLKMRLSGKRIDPLLEVWLPLLSSESVLHSLQTVLIALPGRMGHPMGLCLPSLAYN